MRSITRHFALIVLVLASSPILMAGPRYARLVVGTREAVLPARCLVEEGFVYAHLDLLRLLGADYAAGEHKATLALGEGTADIDLVERNGSRMFRVDEAAKALDIEYAWDDATSTVRLLARLVSVEFEDSTLTARLTLPVGVASARLWQDPWRISFDLPGARLATAEKTISVAGSDLSQIRLGQFTYDTARIVLDLNRKTGHRVLTKGLSREIKVLLGGLPVEHAGSPGKKPKPKPAEPVTITAVGVEPEGDSKVSVRISATGRAVFKSMMLSDPLRVVVDVENATLALPAAEMPVEHPILSQVRTGLQNGAARVVLDAARYVAFGAAVAGNDILVTLWLPRSAGGKLSEKVVVLDPGHGGKDPGAQCRGVKEKEVVLLIARRIKAALEEEGARVIMTRDDDTYLELVDRPAVADAHRADFFISIHCNALTPESRSGVETYYHPGQPSSRTLAFAVHDRVVRSAGMKDRGARLDTVLYTVGLAVLRHANVPAILLECGYIDCSADRRLLCDDEFRGKLARGVVDGLRQYVEGTIESGEN